MSRSNLEYIGYRIGYLGYIYIGYLFTSATGLPCLANRYKSTEQMLRSSLGYIGYRIG